MPMSLKQLVERRLDELGLNPFEAATRAGLNRLFIRDILKDRKKSVQGNNQARLALALDMTVEDLVKETSEALPPVQAEAFRKPGHPANINGGEVRLAPIAAPQPMLMPQDVPIYGTAAGSVIGEFEGFNFSDGEIGFARRPPGLQSHRDAYAIYVVNDSMYPEHRAGDLRFATPHRPPAVGDTVIIQVRMSEDAPVQAFIKTLVKQTRDSVIVSQHNPPAQMEFRREYIVAIHRVPPLNDLYGV